MDIDFDQFIGKTVSRIYLHPDEDFMTIDFDDGDYLYIASNSAKGGHWLYFEHKK